MNQRRFLSSLALPTFTLLASGCTESLTSDNAIVSVEFPEVQDIDDRLIVEGTRMCPDTIRDLATGQTVTDCYTIAADGSWAAEDACFVAAEPGPATLALTAQACTVDNVDFAAVDDTLTVETVPPAEAVASVAWLEAAAADPDVVLTEPVPDGLVPTDGEPIRVVAGGDMRLSPQLRRNSDTKIVGWGTPDTSAHADGVGVEATWDGSDGNSDIVITVAAGADAVVQWTMSDGTWPVAEVVAEDGPLTLESIYVAVLVNEDGTSGPLAARALVHDADGEVVFGAPLAWSSDILDLSAGTENDLPSSDYVVISDACRDPNTLSGEQTASLTATLDEQSVTVDVIWTPAPGDGSAWTAPEECTNATTPSPLDTTCACATSPALGIGGSGLMLAAALGRRRSATPPRTPAPSPLR